MALLQASWQGSTAQLAAPPAPHARAFRLHRAPRHDGIRHAAQRPSNAPPQLPRRRQLTCARASAGAAGGDELQQSSAWDRAAAVSQQATNLFPVWIVLAAATALTWPSVFTWIQTKWITWGLAATMLGMGLTMKVEDLTNVFQRTPALLLLGLVLQYTCMPLLGWTFSRFGGLSVPLATGIALLSACPGGTASNIVAFIAKGEMGLSIMMTTASTLTAIVATPLITQVLAGALVPVNGMALFMSTLQVVLAPVMLGVLINQRAPETVAKVSRFTPAIATILVAIIVGTTLAHSAEAARSSGLQLLAVVGALHASGFALGYFISRALGLSERLCRTNSIEVGMQNSTLGAVLASLHFADPLVAAPCALSSCTHSVMGSLLAAYWRNKPVDDH